MKKLALLIFVAVVMNYALTIAQEDLTSPYLDSVIMAKMETAHLAGVSACIIKNSEVSWIGNYGFANIEQGVPVDTTTLFYMASVSKTVTCTALMQLWEEGLFDLDDDINEYLPFDVHVPFYPSFPITFRMLFTHTSCIKDNAAVNPYYWGEDSPIALGQFLFDILDPQGANYFPDLNFYNQVPGSVYNYSNVGAALAGYLVETIGDSTFSYQTKERIFNPLQMNETAWFLSEVETSNLAMPYYWNGSELVPYGFYARSTYPAGGLRTSVDQLAKFLLSYMNGGTYLGEQILQSSTIDSIMNPQIPSLDPTQGLFWYKLYLGGRWLWGHEGSNLGAMTYMGFYPDENTGVIVFSNTADYIGYQIVDLLFDYASDSIPCSCLPEGITFTTQEQIDNFQTNYPGCTEIEGDVIISGSNITNLNGLNILTSVGGTLRVGFDGYGNESLTNLEGLENLTTIGGNLIVGGHNYGGWMPWNPVLSSLSGLDNLVSIGGNLIILNNPELSDLTGLYGITSIQGNLTINENYSLTNCSIQNICDYLNTPSGIVEIYKNGPGCNSQSEVAAGCGGPIPCLPYGNYYFISQADIDNFQANFPGCNELAGNLTINGNDITNLTGLNQVISIAGHAMIQACLNLTSLSGLNNLLTVGGSLQLMYNSSLINLTGFENLHSVGGLRLCENYQLSDLSGLENLDSIGGWLAIGTIFTGVPNPPPGGNDVLVSINSLASLTYVGGGIDIGRNNSLPSLAGLENINANTVTDLLIGNNNSLTTCDVQSICDYLISPNGLLTISNNAPGCNSEEEVEEHCLTKVEEIKTGNELTIIPNPSNDKITISSSALTGITRLSIFNVSGEKVLERELTAIETQIDIGALPRGVYFVGLQNEKMVEVGKMVKE